MPKPYESSTGTYTGTGAAQQITIGFKPNFIQILTFGLGDRGVKTNDIASDSYYNLITGALSTGGVTLNALGFLLSPDGGLINALNILGETYYYTAVS